MIARGIPIHSKDGTVKCFTVVDAADFERFGRFRWQLRDGKYPYVYRCKMRDGVTRRIYLHREILGLERGDNRRGDHINGDLLDNRGANLRIATDAQNAQNQGSRGGTSQYRGVHWCKRVRLWVASACVGGRKVTLGRYADEAEAARVAAEYRAEHMPFSAEAREREVAA